MLNAVIDRFEGKYAVLTLEGQFETLNVLRKQLPRKAREGDHLQIEVDGTKVIRAEVDKAATEEARQRIQEKMERLRRGNHLR